MGSVTAVMLLSFSELRDFVWVGGRDAWMGDVHKLRRETLRCKMEDTDGSTEDC